MEFVSNFLITSTIAKEGKNDKNVLVHNDATGVTPLPSIKHIIINFYIYIIL